MQNLCEIIGQMMCSSELEAGDCKDTRLENFIRSARHWQVRGKRKGDITGLGRKRYRLVTVTPFAFLHTYYRPPILCCLLLGASFARFAEIVFSFWVIFYTAQFSAPFRHLHTFSGNLWPLVPLHLSVCLGFLYSSFTLCTLVWNIYYTVSQSVPVVVIVVLINRRPCGGSRKKCNYFVLCIDNGRQLFPHSNW